MKVPGSGPGPSSVSGAPPDGRATVDGSVAAWARPWLGLGMAAVFYVAAGFAALAWPQLTSGLGLWPFWARSLVDVSGLLLIFAVGAFVVARMAGPAVRRALGIHIRPIDLALGVFVALIARSVVELVSPTTGNLAPAFAETEFDRIATVLVLAVGSAVLAPIIEELFFRGAVQRLVHQLGLPTLGTVVAGFIAIVGTTVLFVLLHALPHGAAVPVTVLLPPLLMGVGAGVLVAITGRLGGALVAHVLFNTAGVVLALV